MSHRSWVQLPHGKFFFVPHLGGRSCFLPNRLTSPSASGKITVPSEITRLCYHPDHSFCVLSYSGRILSRSAISSVFHLFPLLLFLFSFWSSLYTTTISMKTSAILIAALSAAASVEAGIHRYVHLRQRCHLRTG